MVKYLIPSVHSVPSSSFRLPQEQMFIQHIPSALLSGAMVMANVFHGGMVNCNFYLADHLRITQRRLIPLRMIDGTSEKWNTQVKG